MVLVVSTFGSLLNPCQLGVVFGISNWDGRARRGGLPCKGPRRRTGRVVVLLLVLVVRHRSALHPGFVCLSQDRVKSVISQVWRLLVEGDWEVTSNINRSTMRVLVLAHVQTLYAR